MQLSVVINKDTCRYNYVHLAVLCAGMLLKHQICQYIYKHNASVMGEQIYAL